jgi:two-component system nitrogen regulation sensor histidine kinase NtrY
LSAERLRRKYAKEIQTDPEVFQTCTDTIVRHVDDIGRMVDEFSAFARMPAPIMKEHELRELCRQTAFLQSTSRGDIRHIQDLPGEPIFAECDSRQIAQALTNLLKNAAEAIDARALPLNGASPIPGEIRLRLRQEEGKITLAVEDNGKGLPIEERHTLTEPYVTTRSKGTGLGLAIVKKIMEDHQGELILSDRPGGGAIVTLTWPSRQQRVEPLSNPEKSDMTESVDLIPGDVVRRA